MLAIDPSREVHVDRRRFDVHASVAKFVEAYHVPADERAALAMGLIGLKLHNQVVFGQVEPPATSSIAATPRSTRSERASRT